MCLRPCGSEVGEGSLLKDGELHVLEAFGRFLREKKVLPLGA